MRLLVFQEEINDLLLSAGQYCHSVYLYTIPNRPAVKRELFTKIKRLDFRCPGHWR